MGPFSGSELLSFLQNNYEQKEETNTHLVHMFSTLCTVGGAAPGVMVLTLLMRCKLPAYL